MVMNASAWATFVAGVRHDLCVGASTPEPQRRALAQFDEMIVDHDLGIAERAWDEGHDSGEIDVLDHESRHATNPYAREARDPD